MKKVKLLLFYLALMSLISCSHKSTGGEQKKSNCFVTVDFDFEQTLADCQQRCSEKDAPACLQLGHIRNHSTWASTNQDDALKYYDMACSLESVDLMTNASGCYYWAIVHLQLYGELGVAERLHKSCELGMGLACYVEGLYMIRKTGNISISMNFIDQACKLGTVDACPDMISNVKTDIDVIFAEEIKLINMERLKKIQ